MHQHGSLDSAAAQVLLHGNRASVLREGAARLDGGPVQGREQRGRVGRAHTSCRWLLTDPERRPQGVLRRLLVPARLGAQQIGL